MKNMPNRKRTVRSDGNVYPSAYAAAVDFVLNSRGYYTVSGVHTHIKKACRGKARSAYGYGWRYEEVDG